MILQEKNRGEKSGVPEEAVREAYGSNYERLAALKSKYDPTNFFSLNHNIKPTTQSGATFQGRIGAAEAMPQLRT